MRLIDADDLIETLETYKFGAIQNEAEREYIKETVLNFVKDAPAAYDTEKVVEQLEKLKQHNKNFQKVLTWKMINHFIFAHIQTLQRLLILSRKVGRNGRLRS